LETRQVVSDYLNNHFILEPNIEETKKILSNYLNLIEKRYIGFKDVISNFYKIDVNERRELLDYADYKQIILSCKYNIPYLN